MVTAGKVLFQFAYVAMATVFIAVEIVTMAAVRENGYRCRHELFRVDGQWLWEHAILSADGSTLQRAQGQACNAWRHSL